MPRKRPEWTELRAGEIVPVRVGTSILTDPDLVPTMRAFLANLGYATDEGDALTNGERGLVMLLLGARPNVTNRPTATLALNAAIMGLYRRES